MRLEDLQPNAVVRGILPDALVTVINVHWFGSEALELTYKSPTGMGLLAQMSGRAPTPTAPVDTQTSAAGARAIIMEIERRLGFDPSDRELEKLGYYIESRVPGTGKLRFIEVKGRVSTADTVTVIGSELVQSQVCRSQEELIQVQEEWRAAFEAKGFHE